MLPVDLWTFLARRVPVWSNLEPELRVPAPSQAIADEYVLTRLAELIEDGTAAAVLDRVVARQRGNRAASVLVAFRAGAPGSAR